MNRNQFNHFRSTTRGYEMYVTNDPASLSSPIATNAGQQPSRIDAPATTARYIRIVQTGSDPTRFWSIYELNVFNK